MTHWLAKWPEDKSYLNETTIYGDCVRHLVEKRGGLIDFDVGMRRLKLGDDQMFWEGRIKLDLEI